MSEPPDPLPDEPAVTRESASSYAEKPPSRYREQIGPYRIVRQLGLGGQGASTSRTTRGSGGRSRSRSSRRSRPRADKRALERFRREAEITASLDHPGISTAYDFGETDGVPWIAMRYVEGESLAAKLAAARRSADTLSSEQ